MSRDYDPIDAAVESRDQRTGQPAVDALNAAVPKADALRRDRLEQRLLEQLQSRTQTERKSIMNYAPPLGGTRSLVRLPISTSLLLTAAVIALCAAALLFDRLNPPPEEQNLPVAAPVDEDQDQQLPSPTPPTVTATPVGRQAAEPENPESMQNVPTALEPTGTPFPVMPTDVSPTALPLLPTLVHAQLVPDEIRPPDVWLPGGAHISAAGSTGLMVSIPAERIIATGQNPALIPGETGHLNLFAAVGVPADRITGAPPEGGDLALAWVPVAMAAQLLSVNELGHILVWVTHEQGIVLTWLLNDTHAPFYFERVE